MRIRSFLILPFIFLLSTIGATGALGNLSLHMPEKGPYSRPIREYSEQYRPKSALFPPRTTIGLIDTHGRSPGPLTRPFLDFYFFASVEVEATLVGILLEPEKVPLVFSPHMFSPRSGRGPPAQA